MVTRVFIQCPSLWLQEGHLRGKKKLLGDLMILVISSVFHELWFIPALREHLTVRATKTYLCNVTVRVAYVVGHQTPLLLLK